jgi:hypothetical protein
MTAGSGMKYQLQTLTIAHIIQFVSVLYQPFAPCAPATPFVSRLPLVVSDQADAQRSICSSLQFWSINRHACCLIVTGELLAAPVVISAVRFCISRCLDCCK